MTLPNIFNVNLAQQINAGLNALLLPVVLIKTSSAPDPSNPTRRIKTRTSHPGKGFTDSKDVQASQGTLIVRTVSTVSILGASLPNGITPVPGDEIETEGTTYTIAEGGVSRDPAGALFECVTV